MKRIFNATIIKKDTTEKVDIIIDHDRILEVSQPGKYRSSKFDEEIDANKLIVFPGFIDSHVHFDDPGFTEREDFETGTRSAVAGGVTTVIDMPCTSVPPVIDEEAFVKKLSVVSKKAICDFSFWGGVTPYQIQNGTYQKTILELAKLGVVGFKFYTISGMELYPRMSVKNLHKAFSLIKDYNLICAVHAEDFELVDFYSDLLMNSGRKDPDAWVEGRVYEAEPMAILEVVGITRKIGNKLHIVHLSTEEGLKIVKWAKEHKIDITTETCPHYLVFTSKDLNEKGSILKTTPPIREEEDRDALWEGLRDGTIDFLVTDHAAGIYPDEKIKDSIFENYAGIPGVETLFSVVSTFGFHKKRLTLQKIQEIMSERTAKRFGLTSKGKIEVGYDADFAFVDLNRVWSLEAGKLQSKGKYSPFEGFTLKGKVVKTMVRGKIVYDGDSETFGEKGSGKFIRSSLFK